MGKADWSLDHLEQELAAGFALLGRSEGLGGLGAGESAALADGVLQCMNGALMKVSESLEAQSALRRELAHLCDDFRHAQSTTSERIKALEAEVASLRQDLVAERGRVRQALLSLSAKVGPSSPPEEHLTCPLVLRSALGEFLGVADPASQPLSLAGFLQLVDGFGSTAKAQRPGRVVASCWEANGEDWDLTLSILSPKAHNCYILETRSLRTPSGNLVTLLASMSVDGKPVPQDFVVRMFRQLRESLQEN